MLARAHDDGGVPGDDVAGHAFRSPLSRAVPTLVRLSSSQAGVPEGVPLALAAAVVAVGGGDAPPATGEVTFHVNGRRLGAAAIDTAGQAVLDGVHLPVGVHAIIASYAGDDRHAAATSSPLPQAITAAATPVVVLIGSPRSTPDGVVIEAEVVDPHTGRLADDAVGELVFSAGRGVVGSAPLQAGLARITLAALPPGRLRATFTGDREHAPAEGSLPPELPADAGADPYPDAR